MFAFPEIKLTPPQSDDNQAAFLGGEFLLKVSIAS